MNSFGTAASPGEMMVTWVTWNSSGVTVVAFGPALNWMWNRAIGTEKLYIDEGDLHRAYYVHRVLLTGLNPGNKYCTLPCLLYIALFPF